MKRYPYPIRIEIALLATALVLFAPRATWADPVDDHIAAQTDKVDASVATRMKNSHIPGLSLAVVHNGNPVLVRHYGLANVEWSVPTAPDTVYEIGSITKQFTATLVMMLVEEGNINLDDKITALLPDLPDAWSAVTVRHFLTHTSGIKDYTSLPNFLKRVVRTSASGRSSIWSLVLLSISRPARSGRIATPAISFSGCSSSRPPARATRRSWPSGSSSRSR
jgi:CubicO group peptidase (beta-lactamase class C family)